MDVTQTNNE